MVKIIKPKIAMIAFAGVLFLAFLAAAVFGILKYGKLGEAPAQIPSEKEKTAEEVLKTFSGSKTAETNTNEVMEVLGDLTPQGEKELSLEEQEEILNILNSLRENK